MRASRLRLVLVVLAVAGGAQAGGNPATKLKGGLVEAHTECVAPNTAVSNAFPVTGAPACTPSTRADPGCGFGPKGTGKFSFVAGKRGLDVSIVLNGLDAGCEGATLSLVVGARAVTAACAAGDSCTIVDSESGFLFPARPCTVTAGRCTLAGSMPAGDLPASITEVAVTGVQVRRGQVTTFEAGLRLPAGTR